MLQMQWQNEEPATLSMLFCSQKGWKTVWGTQALRNPGALLLSLITPSSQSGNYLFSFFFLKENNLSFVHTFLKNP